MAHTRLCLAIRCQILIIQVQLTTDVLMLYVLKAHYQKTATRFKVNTRAAATNADTNANFSFIVAATNALPPKGGTRRSRLGADKGERIFRLRLQPIGRTR